MAVVVILLVLAGGGYGQNPRLETQNSNQTPSLPPVDGGERVVRAVRCAAPKIDGVMDTEWYAATPADRFVQRQPVEGAPEVLPTRVFVLYDDDAINVCFVCNENPDSLSARVLRRDNSTNCDVVGVYFDSFHDHRNCYYFGVTAAGGQIDGVMSNESNSDDTWDGVWESAVGRTDSGWVAELRIPFSSFRHGGARADGWGTNFERAINRRQEDVFWQPVNDQRGVRVGEFGTLLGLENIGASRHLDLRPHVVGRWDAPQNRTWASRNEWENLGIYVKYVPSSSWTADFTYQPDFAQVDVDEEVINTSDYPVFLTEKRPFFLEVGNFFDTSPIQLLYTRRITDPDFGGRIYGQSEKFRGMVLGGQNRTADGHGQAVGAGRASWNVGRYSSVGFTGTAVYQDAARTDILLDEHNRSHNHANNFYATTGGIDSRIRWSEENNWAVSGAGVSRVAELWDTDPVESAPHRYDRQPFEARSNLHLSLHPLPMKLDLNDSYRGQDYNINDLGWGDFSNSIEHHVSLSNIWQVRPTFIRTYMLDLEGWQRMVPDGRFPEGGVFFNTSITTKSNIDVGAGTDWGVDRRRVYTNSLFDGEFRDSYFELPGYGRFNFEKHPYHTQWGWLETDDRRWLIYATETNIGTFREGQKQIWNNKLTVKPRTNLETSLTVDWTKLWDVGDLNDYAPTEARIYYWSTHYSPTLDLSLRATLQWIDKGDGQITGYPGRTLLTNLLLAWNWRPGSWVYLVYDEGRTTPLNYHTEGDRTIRAKATYFFTVK